MVEIPTKQEKVGYKNPPKKNQFGQPEGNPRHNGAWKKESTPRYKIEQMMTLTEGELYEIVKDKTRPHFERKIANIMHDGKWREIKDMIEQVYGAPKNVNETIISGEITENKRPYEGLTKEEIRKALGK